jgi:Rha family phage regulatory protein
MLVEIKTVNKEEVTVVTSLDVAETFGKEHARVLRDIRELDCSEEFRHGNFAESYYVNAQNKKQPMYYITRDGFTLLAMGYTGEKAMQFKEAYIKQFNAMEKALIGKIREREKGIGVRRVLTDSLQRTSENERMHGHAYSTYTDLIYKSVFGKTAKKLRLDLNIGNKENIRDYLTEEELLLVQNAEMLVSSLVGYGWGYGEIKEFLENKSVNKLVG